MNIKKQAGNQLLIIYFIYLLFFVPLPIIIKLMQLSFVIDKITDCIENRVTGEEVMTIICPIHKDDLKNVLKKNGWLFNWKDEYNDSHKEVYKLTINGEATIEGLICISIEDDHIFMHLLESAPSNRGKDKVYLGVAGNLVAFACKHSLDLGFEGCIAFIAKTELIEHYEDALGAIHIGNQRMIIETGGATKLIETYFNETKL